jgi:hypothetical protein
MSGWTASAAGRWVAVDPNMTTPQGLVPVRASALPRTIRVGDTVVAYESESKTCASASVSALSGPLVLLDVNWSTLRDYTRKPRRTGVLSDWRAISSSGGTGLRWSGFDLRPAVGTMGGTAANTATVILPKAA